MRRKDREIKDMGLIESIISRCDVCRIAFADNNTPYIVAMNFGYEGGSMPVLYFHCANTGRKLEMAAINDLVCFEMDTDHEIYTGEIGCDWGMKYSSVVGYGKISTIQDDAGRRHGLNRIMDHYGGKGDYKYDEKVFSDTTIIKIEITEMTAKQKN